MRSDWKQYRGSITADGGASDAKAEADWESLTKLQAEFSLKRCEKSTWLLFGVVGGGA